MSKYIDADKLLADLQEELSYHPMIYTEEQNAWFDNGLKRVVRIVKSYQSADVVPRSEVERLEKQIKELLISEVCELHIPMEIAFRVRKGHPVFKAIKSEVVKEFAERLEKKKCHYSETEYTFDFDGVTVEDINAIAKEMTEEHYETQ